MNVDILVVLKDMVECRAVLKQFWATRTLETMDQSARMGRGQALDSMSDACFHIVLPQSCAVELANF